VVVCELAAVVADAVVDRDEVLPAASTAATAYVYPVLADLVTGRQVPATNATFRPVTGRYRSYTSSRL
jgi:hypothetical protein